MVSAPFKSRLARKVFILFILAALIPLSVGSFISYRHVNNIIQTDSLYNLQSASKEYGLSLFFRLKLAKDTLFNNTSNIQESNLRSQAYKSLSTYFSAIAYRAETSSEIVKWGHIDGKLLSSNTWGNRSLMTIQRADNKHDVYIRLNNGMIGKVNSKYLWNTDTLNIENHFCVTNHLFEKIFCQDNINDKNMSEIKNISNQRKEKKITLNIDGNDLLLTYWPLFMDHEFGINDWYIIASQNDTVISNRLKDYTGLFFSLIIFSLLLVTLLSSILIRKNLGVINKLIHGTKEITKGNFNQTISIDSQDELAELAQSFNIMSKNMETIVDEYKAFSEIDKLILNHTDTKNIIKSIFNHINNIISLDNIYIINHSKNHYDLETIYQFNKNFQKNKNQTDKIYSKISKKLIKKSTVIKYSEEESLHDDFLSGRHNLLVIPIINNKKFAETNYIIGILSGNFTSDIELKKLDIFASRIAIAFQALSREKELRYQANYDGLTKLPNKNNIITTYQDTQQQLSYVDGVFAILFLDLDHFKQVNDNYGHLVGDKLLKEFSKRIQNIINSEEKIARLGGDEFVLLVKADRESALSKRLKVLCNKIIKQATQPFHIDGQILHIGASIGVDIDKSLTQDFDDAIRHADIAMYFSKKNGGNQYSIYENSMSTELLERTLLERDFRSTLNRKGLELYFQPKFYAKDQTLSGFEALLRWKHPEHGFISPFVTVEIAERVGLISQLGELIFEKSIEQLQSWLEKGYHTGSLAINISPKQLLADNFSRFIQDTLKQFPLVKPGMVELEVTESIMLENKASSISILKDIKQAGLRIAIDDFGTGYSSLSYLLELPTDTIKIDRAFVVKIENDPNALQLLDSVIKLGKNMGYRIVAEGVATQYQVDFLVNCEIDELQGYYFSKPLPAETAEKQYLNKNN